MFEGKRIDLSIIHSSAPVLAQTLGMHTVLTGPFSASSIAF
jgi:hypothetical protein